MTEPAVLTLNALYQLIGQKEVELAVLREQIIAMRAELAEIRAELAPPEPESAG